MRKEILAVVVALSIFGVSIENNVFAKEVAVNMKNPENINALRNFISLNQNNGDFLKAEIKNIKLEISSYGIIKRSINGSVSPINYNSLYGSDCKFLKLFNWNGYFAALIYDNISGEKQVIISGLGFIWQPVEYDYFAESDINYVYGTKYKVNDIDVYGDQLYLACDDGIVIVITPCVKCYKLKKFSDNDIKTISFQGDTVKLNENTQLAFEIPISDIRQNNISVEEAFNMKSSGALFIDVRDENEFNQYHYNDSINIPVSRILEILKYDRNAVLIFFCKSGGRAGKALSEAQKMGFVNVYNVGSVDKLIEY